jgi:3-phenylpropionate/trans-cinnamate dioxygenase ferredoxin reductase subunit
VEAALTADGNRVACDFVVAGVGIEPEVPTLVGSSVAHSNGVLVDERCRAGHPDVYAAGDVANQLHPLFGRVRVEHFNNAEKQGRAAARSMLGATTPYDYVHSFWSDQYEHKLEYVGHAVNWDQFIVRGSLEERQFVGFYLDEGQIHAAVGLDRGGDPELDQDSEMAACAQLVAQRARPTHAQLANEKVDLWSFVR